MIEFEGKKFLNEQEAYLYCLEEIKKLKQSLGNALPNPIQGPQGETGATGARGPEGPRGTGVFGCTAVLPSATAYQEGDFYILFDGSLFKKINGSWVRQSTLKGPQGPVGLPGGTEVVANPADAATDDLGKIKIDGTTYNILPTAISNFLNGIVSDDFSYVVDEDGNYYDFDCDVVFEGKIVVYSNDLSDVTDEYGNPIIICSNLKDTHGNARFIEGNLTTETISGVTFTYAKWSLSGSHLMVVLCGEIASGTTIGVVTLATATLPDYIKNKIVGVFATDYIAIHDDRAYYDDWNSISLQNALYKADEGLGILQIANPTTTASAHFRIQYDLIIAMD